MLDIKTPKGLLLLYLILSVILAAIFYYLVMSRASQEMLSYALYVGIFLVLIMTVSMSGVKVKSFFRVPLFYLLMAITLFSFAFLDATLVRLMSILFTLLDGIYVFYLNYKEQE